MYALHPFSHCQHLSVPPQANAKTEKAAKKASAFPQRKYAVKA